MVKPLFPRLVAMAFIAGSLALVRLAALGVGTAGCSSGSPPSPPGWRVRV